MRTMQLNSSFGIDSLQLVNVPAPQVGTGQIRLKMRAWSLNYRDLMVVRGQYNPKLKLPFVPLSDGVGEITEIGEGVSDLKLGQRCCPLFMQQWQEGSLTDAKSRSALGGAVPGIMADEVVLDSRGVVPVPVHLTDLEAATLPCAAVTAWHALMGDSRLRPGSTVLVQGTGGVSIFALQFAKLSGARVICTSSSDSKLERARQLGADFLINYRKSPDWEVQARDLTDGRGVDHIVEVGGAGTLPRSFKAVCTAGTISLIGVLTGGGGEVNPISILMKNIKVQGIYVGSGDMFWQMNQAITQHGVRPVIDRVFSFEELAEAMRYQESGQHFGKIAITA